MGGGPEIVKASQIPTNSQVWELVYNSKKKKEGECRIEAMVSKTYVCYCPEYATITGYDDLIKRR